MLFHFRIRSSFGHPWLKASAALHKITLAAAAAAAALSLSACVESQKPLLTDAKPTLGQQFEIHLYETFVDGKASNFHSTSYSWKDGKYVRASELAQDVARFVSQPLEQNDVLIEGIGENESLFNYWIGRKLVDGVYLIFPVSEDDSDAATRDAACAKDQPKGVCLIGTYDQLVTLARATAAKPVHAPSLGVVLAK
jgi:hypothetical protein